MPIDYSKYPPNWKTEIRPRILERANNRCEFCDASNYDEHPITGSYVVLTIAHLDRDPENWDVKDDRLAALCQRCHLNYDRKDCQVRRSGSISQSLRFGKNFKKHQLKLDLTYYPQYDSQKNDQAK